LGGNVVSLAGMPGLDSTPNGDAGASKSGSGSVPKLTPTDPVAVAKASAHFIKALVTDPAFRQMVSLLIMNSIIFALLYFITWKFLKPTWLYHELIDKEQEVRIELVPQMRGDDFVSVA